MGENTILNKEQELVLSELSNSNLIKSQFYFGGGTALSEVYLKHRESVDLDFFSDSTYSQQEIFNIISNISQSQNSSIESQVQENTQVYFLGFKERTLKVDFAYYPYKRLQEGTHYNGLLVDSKLDIAVNKLMLIASQRTEVKDYVDLFFLFKEFSIWDLMEGVIVKFNMKLDPYMIATDFTAIEAFEFLPKMHKSLTLEELKEFYLKQARELGGKAAG